METAAIGTTVALAGASIAVLALLGVPLAWWLANTRSRWAVLRGVCVVLRYVQDGRIRGLGVAVDRGLERDISAASMPSSRPRPPPDSAGSKPRANPTTAESA